MALFLSSLALAAVAGASSGKPNFVFIMTDDQDLHLNSLDYQPLVRKHFVEQGTWFRKHFCTVSVCCPSRVSLLTGKAAHNTNVTDVVPPYGGYEKFVAEGLNDEYLPVWLQVAKYKTYYTGKLMNGHSVATYNKPFAAGWTRSDFLIDPNTYAYYNASMVLDNGPFEFRPGQYSTDLVASRASEFLEDAIAEGEPFFLGVAPIAPHSEVIIGDSIQFLEPVPADRHKDLFPCVTAPRSGSFNRRHNGSVGYFAGLPPLSDSQVAYGDGFHRRRLQALQAVDELVDTLVSKLEAHLGVLENTYLFYTSDNGFHIGQHRLPPGKTCSIEEDINIPFLARGPGIAAGAAATFQTSHTDVVPTLFELAGIPPHDDFDGEPIRLGDLAGAGRQEHVNVEYWGSGLAEGTVFPGRPAQAQHVQDAAHRRARLRLVIQRVVHQRARAVRHQGASKGPFRRQQADRQADPLQLTNLYGADEAAGFPVAELTARLDALLLTLKSCKGRVCRRPWETLMPGVAGLREAMGREHDDFFRRQPKVTFSACLPGYITSAEGALKPVPLHEMSLVG